MSHLYNAALKAAVWLKDGPCRQLAVVLRSDDGPEVESGSDAQTRGRATVQMLC